jgi:hypothetical protein
MSKQARYSLTTLAAALVDAEAGTIKDVSIMTEGDAAGHGVRVDFRTLEMLHQLAVNGGVKAFLNHSMMPAPTEAVGVFSGFYLDKPNDGSPAKLRGTFKALRAFREHSPREYATLFELAAEAPNAFGVSVSIWQDEDEAEDGGAPYIRPTAFDSADFVSTPAANKSLFSKQCIDNADTQDNAVSTNQLPNVSTDPIHQLSKPARPMLKTIHAKFSAKPDALARAVKYMAENEAATEDDAVAVVEAELSAEEIEQMKTALADITKERDDLAAKLAEITGEKDALAETAAELPAVKEELSKVKGELDASKAQLSAATVRLARYGVTPLKLAAIAKDGEGEAKPVVTLTREQFSALSVADQNKHMRTGGKLTD